MAAESLSVLGCFCDQDMAAENVTSKKTANTDFARVENIASSLKPESIESSFDPGSCPGRTRSVWRDHTTNGSG
jgi:hypothetical protein